MTILSCVRAGSRESRCDRNAYDTDIKSVDQYPSLLKERERLKKDVETLVFIQLKTEFCYPVHPPLYDNEACVPTSCQSSSPRSEFINKNKNVRTRDQKETIQTKRLITESTLTSGDNRRSENFTQSVSPSGDSNYPMLTNLPMILCCQRKTISYNESNDISLYDDKIDFHSGNLIFSNNETIDSDFEHNDEDYHSDNSIGVIYRNSFSSEDEQDNEENYDAHTMDRSKPRCIDKHDRIEHRTGTVTGTVGNTRLKESKDMTGKWTDKENEKEIYYKTKHETTNPIYSSELYTGVLGTMNLVTNDQLRNSQDISNEIIGKSQSQAGKQEIDDYKKGDTLANTIASTDTMYIRGQRTKITYEKPMYKEY